MLTLLLQSRKTTGDSVLTQQEAALSGGKQMTAKENLKVLAKGSGA